MNSDTTTTQSETVFSLRVSTALNEKLVAQARAENRSRQAQIVYLLNRHFELAEAAAVLNKSIREKMK